MWCLLALDTWQWVIDIDANRRSLEVYLAYGATSPHFYVPERLHYYSAFFFYSSRMLVQIDQCWYMSPNPMAGLDLNPGQGYKLGIVTLGQSQTVFVLPHMVANEMWPLKT